ncbi:testis-expressed protein 29 [Acomys russatus]|uniref:testis-expressed protein 29 n=1 Tax=Acomys russatus TaxID=60746 RepID=UPI0021E28714|nr:testis-expressed protein 29 [Acomys russatus]
MKYVPEMKSPPHLLKKFAVCDIPLYDICDYNITRDRCKELGCCFYKGVCYEKAVPVYVQLFTALIVFFVVLFFIVIIYRVVQETKREIELSMRPTSSVKNTEEPEQLSVQEVEIKSVKPSSASSKKETGSQVEATLTISEHEVTED